MIEYTDYKFINFKDVTRPGDVTKMWNVYFFKHMGLVGVVSFRSAINKYMFTPSTANSMDFDARELDEIRSFLVTQTTLWTVQIKTL